MKIADHAAGKWPQIISSLIGPEYVNARKHLPCPCTGEKGKGTPRFRFSDKYGNGNYFCECSDGKKSGFDLVMCAKSCDFRAACEKVESIIGPCPKDDIPVKVEKTFAERIRERARKTKASNYLASRGLEVAPGLDWIKALSYVDSDGKKVGEFAAMLAPIVRAGKFITYHVTYLEGGKKANLEPNRKIMPANTATNGGACPLYESAEKMGIAEGVETAIAAKLLSGLPTWAALNTALLKSWEPPANVRDVTIFADNDSNYAGQAAAYALAHRLAAKGIAAKVELPGSPDTDWNDVLLQMRSAA